MRKSGYVLFLLAIIFVCNLFVIGQDSKKNNDKSKENKSSWINTKYDKSKDLTTVRLKKFTITRISQEKVIGNNIPLHQMDLEISFNHPGQKIAKQIEDINLRFQVVSSNYIFLRAQPIIAVLNKDIKGQDRALGLGTTEYKSTAPKFNSVYEEFLSIKVSSNVIAKMAEAETVEIYVGPVDYQLTPEQHNAIKELSLLLSPAASSAISPK